MSEDRITSALRGPKRNSRERKELTDPDLRDSHIEKPDDVSDDNYGPRNPSVKSNQPRYSKAEVGFEHPAKGRDDCDDCVHFQGRDNETCELVKGEIQAEDWCRKFKQGGHDESEEKE